MSIFAKQIGISLERARLFQEVQSLAVTDPLTSLQNRRSLFEVGRVEFSRADRMNRPFSCLMLDLDHFKQINDYHGHFFGDQVLQSFAERCKALVREVDLVGRFGGKSLSSYFRKQIERPAYKSPNACGPRLQRHRSRFSIRRSR